MSEAAGNGTEALDNVENTATATASSTGLGKAAVADIKRQGMIREEPKTDNGAMSHEAMIQRINEQYFMDQVAIANAQNQKAGHVTSDGVSQTAVLLHAAGWALHDRLAEVFEIGQVKDFDHELRNDAA